MDWIHSTDLQSYYTQTLPTLTHSPIVLVDQHSNISTNLQGFYWQLLVRPRPFTVFLAILVTSNHINLLLACELFLGWIVGFLSSSWALCYIYAMVPKLCFHWPTHQRLCPFFWVGTLHNGFACGATLVVKWSQWSLLWTMVKALDLVSHATHFHAGHLFPHGHFLTRFIVHECR